MAKSRRAATASTTASVPKPKRPKSPTKHSSSSSTVKSEALPRAATYETEFEAPECIDAHFDGGVVPSSPTSSIDDHHGKKVMDGVSSPVLSSSDEEHGHHGDDAATSIVTDQSPHGHQRVPSLSLSEYAGEAEHQHVDADYGYHREMSPGDDPESQWESDGGAGGAFHDHKSHGGGPKSTTSGASPGSVSRSRKAPSSPSGSGKRYQQPSRQSTMSPRLHLAPSSRRQTNYYHSRASSVSYSELGLGGEERKAPLVLLHMSLILLPGAEEPILRKITPTMLQRGLLIEHPRSDYQLLEELIFDALGLDEPYNLDKDEIYSEEEEKEMSETAAWEKSMGIRRIVGREKWELRIYASNGLMTAGAWRKVWNDMERIDVEIGPKDWRGRKTGDLLRDFSELSGGQIGGLGNDSGEFEDELVDQALECEEAEPEYLQDRKPRLADLFTIPTTAEGRIRWAAVALLAVLLLVAIGSSVSSAMGHSWRRNGYEYDYPVFSARTERYMDHIDRYAAAAKNKDTDGYVRVIMMNPEPTKISTVSPVSSSVNRFPEIREPADDVLPDADQDDQQPLERREKSPGDVNGDSGLVPDPNAGCPPAHEQAPHPSPILDGQLLADTPTEHAREESAP